MNTVLFKNNAYVPHPSQSWTKKDDKASKFFVYILKLNNGTFYVGQTRELLERLLEHKESQTFSTAGENPKLWYFEIHPTREDVMRREHELKTLIRKNKREIFRIVRNFHELISKVDIA